MVVISEPNINFSYFSAPFCPPLPSLQEAGKIKSTLKFNSPKDLGEMKTSLVSKNIISAPTLGTSLLTEWLGQSDECINLLSPMTQWPVISPGDPGASLTTAMFTQAGPRQTQLNSKT